MNFPLPSHLGPALLLTSFGLGLTQALSLHLLLMVVVVAVVVVAVVLSPFCGQNLAIWPISLHAQHLGRLPSTTTIVCRSPLIRVSGMALKPSLVRHSRKV